MRTASWISTVLLILATHLHATEIHVAIQGNDANSGTPQAPLRTIGRAAELAQAGDVITVHEGVYRERVNPARGGESDSKRIVYQAAEGEKVQIKGSEVIKNWVKVQDDVWKVTLDNSFFGSFNPYNDIIHGDWFNPKNRKHHTGAVYLNGEWLTEAATLNDVLKPVQGGALWFAGVDGERTTIWAQFKDVNPNDQLVEMNIRQSVFYPQRAGINYITVRGFIMRDAATPWAPPTAQQIALIGTNWSRGWIIENNVISHSVCCGISLGKYGDQWDNTSANTAEGYVATIERALQNGWNKQIVGHHVVRNNTISYCEQAGIVGSLGAAFSTITGNTIHDIHMRRLFSGAEMAGIKLHGAIDVEIRGNRIYRTCLGVWLDWMAQGTRVSGNLFHDNSRDLFVEVDHGPFVVDNNLFLSSESLDSRSQGGGFVHNLFCGTIKTGPFDSRQTPFLKAHSTEVAGLHDNPSGDDRYYNNLFVQRGDLSQYDRVQLPVWMDGNVFLSGARPSAHEVSPLVKPEFDPAIRLAQKSGGLYLEMNFDLAWADQRARPIVSTELLGRTAISDLPYERSDGALLRINTDYFGKQRSLTNPTPGPFERPGNGAVVMKLW